MHPLCDLRALLCDLRARRSSFVHVSPGFVHNQVQWLLGAHVSRWSERKEEPAKRGVNPETYGLRNLENAAGGCTKAPCEGDRCAGGCRKMQEGPGVAQGLAQGGCAADGTPDAQNGRGARRLVVAVLARAIVRCWAEGDLTGTRDAYSALGAVVLDPSSHGR